MSGQTIGQLVGMAIGFMTGLGPLAIAIGGAIGGAVGSTFDPTQKFEGPRLTDLKIQTSSYGVPLALVYGPNNRVAGTVIWSTGLIETRKKKKSGGKGGGGGSSVTTYSYRTSAAISLSEGECNNIRRIWANGKKLFDIAEVQAEVDRLQTKATNLETYASTLEAQLAADPNNLELATETAEARRLADAAAATAAAAAANYTTALAGGGPWSLVKGSGLPRGPLGGLAFYPGSTTQTPDPTIEAKLGAGNVPAYRGVCYVVLKDLQLANYGNSLPNLEFELDGLAPRTVGAIVHDICTRSGMEASEFSVRSQLYQEDVEGYVIATAGSSMAAIQPLAGVFFFDAAEQSGEVRFIPRGLGPVAAIEPEDMAARERQDGETPARFEMTLVPDFDLPREVSVTYRDPDRDYQDNTQRAVRLYGDAHSIVTIQAPVTMQSESARQVADRALWAAYSDRFPGRFQLTDKYRFLAAGDTICAKFAGTWLPLRIDHRMRGVNGVIDLELSLEDPFVYQGSLAGEGATVPANDSSSVGTTFVAALNTPILAAGQSGTSFMWVMDAEAAGWGGGGIYRSTDATASFSEMATSNERNITGAVAAALPAGATDIWDRVNTITVTLLHEDHELESLPESDVLNGKNAVWLGRTDGSHGEVLQFATATLVTSSPRVYELSDLLRGRRATEHEVSLHTTDELFVFLEADLMHTADYDTPDWDRIRWYKGVSVYEDPDDVGDYQEFTNEGERAKPRSPVHGAGSRDGSNNLTLTWMRRIRGFQNGIGYGPLALDEATESYEVDIIVSGNVVRTIAASSTTASYSAAQQTADGITPGNPVTFRVYQLSATRGRGHKGEFTV